MCGIAGIWNRSGEPVDGGALERMSSLLVHRGPDGDGVHLDEEVGLASRRLAIIDLSHAADQPMALEERGLWLTYNGEIHNYVELRRELEAAGARFRTDSDTEVVLHAYDRWGLGCFDRFNGMWAIALWDASNRQLVLSRDRFGIKPLYYSVRGQRVCFASEVKAIVEAFPEERRPNWPEISSFLAGRAPDRGAPTFFANVHSVLPATALVVRPDGERPARYWSFEPGDEQPKRDAEERFRGLLADAVRVRLRSDVPVGACLSGGLDSSAIVRLLDPAHRAMHCFSLRYDEPAYDESRYAALAAGGDGRRFTMHWVRPDPGAMLQTIRKIVWHHDAPTPQRGRFPQWFVMEEAGRHVKVVLDGQGGDELLAGYGAFVRPYLADRLRLRGSVPAELSKPLAAEVGDFGAMGGRSALSYAVSAVPRLAWHRVGAAQRGHTFVQTAAFRRSFPVLRRERPAPYRAQLNNALWTQFTIDGLPELLHAEDALSMAFSIESRTPFVDHRLVEFCFSLPFWEKMGGGWTKSLLRRALADDLPPEILARRRKLGFPAPVGPWLARDENWRDVQGVLLDRRTLDRGIFRARRLERALDRFRGAPEKHFLVDRLWRWLTLELWFRDFVDARRPDGSTP